MTITKLHLLVFIFIIFLSIITIINGIVIRCYLCSQNTLVECAGSNQPDSSIYTTVLQYYTEPCNGQCVLFRNENHSIIRGCSWTYGQMTPKSIGWHEISPSIKAYFCNTHLCNNGTYEQPQISLIRTGIIDNQFILSPQQLLILTGNNPSHIQIREYFSRSLHQCYSCTARFQGCGEFLDPHYASHYIRPCPSSCIIFRNPNDLNLITRDCSIFWPQARAKSGFHKLLGSDAFFCQGSLCNGISFDFIMGIFHNQLPAVIKFPPISTTTTTTTTTTLTTTINIYNDPDLDFSLVESTTPTTTTSSIDEIFSSTSVIDDLTTTSSNASLNWRNMNNTTLSLSSSTIQIEEDDWLIINTTSIPPITRFEHLSADNTTTENNHKEIELNSEITIDLNDYIPSLTLTTTPSIIDLINNNNIQSSPSLVMPPFSWMLNMAIQDKSIFINSTTTTSKTPEIFYEYCKNKKCHHGGRLNSDCLCICLPAFTGDNCETVLCEQEPADICAFILEHECEINHIRYLCPKFCEMNICFSKEM